ncbi:MAG: HD domain-containing phosphohydrolase [Armatimonadota bacterium]|nr:HD domain-containing protein [bacterium]
MHPSQLLAAVSYMTDLNPEGSCHHSWRVALLGQYLASIIAPDIRNDVFYAGLLQDIGAVGAIKHITAYDTLNLQTIDHHICAHPQRGSAILQWLPGMSEAAGIVRSHHEWWDGRGFPDKLMQDEIPLGSQILHIADAADTAGCFSNRASFAKGLHSLAGLTGCAWSNDLWAAFVGSTKDTAFYSQLLDQKSLSKLIAQTCAELKIPGELDNDEGIERILHLVAALVDLKDPATKGHSIRTARYAQALAKHMNMLAEDVHMAYRAGLVHDCGRLGLPADLVNRTGRISDKELALVRAHAAMTIKTFKCVPDCPEMEALGEIAGHDHERYDGKGYPDGLTGERIPLVSRILSAVDAFDAMISARSDRMLSPKAAVIRLQQNAGTQFDSDVVDAMVDLAGDGGLCQELVMAA